jgi:hypothetical protein
LIELALLLVVLRLATLVPRCGTTSSLLLAVSATDDALLRRRFEKSFPRPLEGLSICWLFVGSEGLRPWLILVQESGAFES